MVARSATIGSPAMSLPRIIGSAPFDPANCSQATSSLKLTIWRCWLGSSIPITVRPGIEETRAEIALMLRAISSARPITRLALIPGAGSSSYMVTTGPVRTASIVPLTLKSSSTVSSRRALRSSPSLSIFGAELGAGSLSRSMLGSSKLSNRSPWRLRAEIWAGLAGREGSVISGALRGSPSITGAAAAARSRLARIAGIASATRSGRAGRRLRKIGRVNRLPQSIAKTRPAMIAPAVSVSNPAIGANSQR